MSQQFEGNPVVKIYVIFLILSITLKITLFRIPTVIFYAMNWPNFDPIISPKYYK